MFGIEIPDIGNIDISKVDLRQVIIDVIDFLRDFLQKLDEAFSSIKRVRGFEEDTLPIIEE